MQLQYFHQQTQYQVVEVFLIDIRLQEFVLTVQFLRIKIDLLNVTLTCLTPFPWLSIE
jgi:hypothetical protein